MLLTMHSRVGLGLSVSMCKHADKQDCAYSAVQSVKHLQTAPGDACTYMFGSKPLALSIQQPFVYYKHIQPDAG